MCIRDRKEYYANPSGVGSLVPPEEPPAATKRQMELYDQIKATGDAAEQEALMQEILQIAADEFYALGISLPAPGYGIVKNNSVSYTHLTLPTSDLG